MLSFDKAKYLSLSLNLFYLKDYVLVSLCGSEVFQFFEFINFVSI